ncbi:MAG: hypothetical protein Q8P36_00365 [bacterium]|nr:hypothetical protein [bacterium]
MRGSTLQAAPSTSVRSTMADEPEDKTIAGFHPAGSDGGVVHLLAPASPNCPNCGAPPSEHHVENYDRMWQDGDVVCKCGTRVRGYDAG